MKNVLVLGAVRSPIGNGRKDSSLLGKTPQDLVSYVLGAQFLKVPIPRSSVESFKLGSVVSLKSNSVTQAPAREIAIRNGMINAASNEVSKACSSGLRAIHEAEEAIRHEGCDLAVGAGVDLMSGVPPDVNLGALRDPITGKSMAVLSDEKALELNFTREDYNRYALESYRRAKEHILEYYLDGYLVSSLIPSNSLVPITTTYDQNIFYREVTAEILANDKNIPGCEITSFKNASKYGDGCGSLLLASPRAAKKWNQKPIAKILGYAEHTVKESKDFITAPVGAVPKALKKAKLCLQDIGSYWINQAFPGSPLSFIKSFNVPWEIVNPWGGAIAFGHPLGATGAILCVNAICQARREGKRYVVVSLCNAIGEATAMVFEIL